MRLKDENKRKAILTASIGIFAKSGFHSAKISHIADKAGIAAGSIYSYFETKEDILLSLFAEIWEKLYREGLAIKNSESMNSAEKLNALIDCVFTMFLENRKLALVFAHEQNQMMRDFPKQFTPRYSEFIDLGELFVKNGKKEGLFVNALNVDIFRSFIMGGIRALLQSWADDPKRFPLAEVKRQIPLIISGVFAD